ncbi:MAG: alpha/beta hydrolase family protein [Hyperionvirus sp.]|uniref:Alpha/beta hydrolase family protein n=1 Tax=Hyperionvirus sp. TaxID=2487770 RepID=A0A3G5AEZ9_9VIRU|nr:MAG: alpha/beta hydrolase family protein [Hyperionvirus sp.]
MGSVSSSEGSAIDSVAPMDALVRAVLYQPIKRDEEFVNKWPTTEEKGVQVVRIASREDKGNTVYAIVVTPSKLKWDKVVIFSHGNGSDVFANFEFQKAFAERFGVVVVAYDYPSYGGTKGVPNEETCRECLGRVVEHVAINYAKKKIILMAHSLGTGVTMSYVACVKWVTPIILISAYMSIPEVVTSSRGLLRNHRYPSITYIKGVACGIKFIHGEDDEVIGISHSKELYKELPNKQFPHSWIARLNHNDILDYIVSEGHSSLITGVLDYDYVPESA